MTCKIEPKIYLVGKYSALITVWEWFFMVSKREVFWIAPLKDRDRSGIHTDKVVSMDWDW